MTRLPFTLHAQATHSHARAASFQALHGEVKTPVFMPVGTRATVRGQTVPTLKEAGSQVVLANTYHLLLRPGPEVFRKFGGIHRFMSWDRPVLTDSGGYQIFCLPHARVMTEEGAAFQSYLDGKRILLSPELSIEMQMAINSDIMMALDQCIPSTAGKVDAENALHLTRRWAVRSLNARKDSPQALFAITQGACYPDLRTLSVEQLTQLPFDGFAIGGLAVGESKNEREDMTEHTAALLPKDKPRYLMGVGMPIDILEAVHRGVDMFDCIIPNALAQQGIAFTSAGKLELRRGAYKFADETLDAGCDCSTCQSYSKAYLHHLIKSAEVLAWQLIGHHNLVFYHRLMREMREHILNDTFYGYYQKKREELVQRDAERPITPPKERHRTRHSLSLGDFEVHLPETGSPSIRQTSSGETMHSVNDPHDEARRLYVEQPRLKERANEQNLVVWDVGLGAAINAMAVLGAWPEDAPHRLSLVSFENNLDALRLTLKHPGHFPHIRHAAPHEVLKNRRWEQGNRSWQLFEGDFAETMHQAPLPDVVLYDPFSFKADTGLWTAAFFAQLFARLHEKPCALYTYSNATRVRVALLSAGFYVASGVPTGPKSETTIALTRFDTQFSLLGADWLRRWERSQNRVPDAVRAEGPEAVSSFEAKIRGHRQFLICDILPHSQGPSDALPTPHSKDSP